MKDRLTASPSLRGRASWACVLSLALVAFVSPGPAAAEPDDLAPYDADLERIARFQLPELDLDLLAFEDETREQAGLPYRFAVDHPVFVTPWTHGTWQRLDDETLIWRYRIQASQAASLNLGFRRFELPPGAELWVYTADGTETHRFTAADEQVHGELWTPVYTGDDVVVELSVAEADRGRVFLELTQINQGYRVFGRVLGTKSGACNVDVACSQGNSWRNEIRSVARYTINGATLCTGSLVNNTNQDLRPLFLTADHCGLTSNNASSVVAYFNYENSSCRTPGSGSSGAPGNGSLGNALTGGAILRMNFPNADTALLEFNNAPSSSWAPYWAGWDRSGRNPPFAVGIHHPRGEEKRISFENDPLTTTQYLSSTSDDSRNWFRVADWDQGTTEGGSSGSPLFNDRQRVIGVLTGGFAACGNNSADWYGKLSKAWNGGGSPSNRLRDWLDPAGAQPSVLGGTATGGGGGGGGTKPAAPTGLTVSPAGASQVQLTWQDNATDETTYRIQRQAAGGSFQDIASLSANSTTYLDSNLASGSYTYRVRARNPAGFSPFSNQATIVVGGTQAPGMPADFVATALPGGGVALSWTPASGSVNDYELQRRRVGESFQRLIVLQGGLSSFSDGSPVAGTIYNYRIRARNSSGSSAWSQEVAITAAQAGGTPDCADATESLCLLDRFLVEVFWRDQRATDRQNTGKAIPESDQTGFFWFFDSSNVELVVKAIDATSLTGRFWFFFGGLSDVEFWITVTDTATGAVKTYYNEPFNICGRSDTSGFLPQSSTAPSSLGAARTARAPLTLPEPAAGSTLAPRNTCVADADTLCLRDGRFAVTVDWEDPRNPRQGKGTAVPDSRSDESGFFWFFEPENIELVVKILDGTAANSKYWVFYGALSDVEYRIDVTDTQTGATKTYTNPAFNFCGRGDTNAFDSTVP